MTISYTLDVSQTNTKSFLKLLWRWRGSIWKAVVWQLFMWTAVYFLISYIYRYLLSKNQQRIFALVAEYLDNKLDSYIPLTFMLGFFVTFVVGRWSAILKELGWIDGSAICFAAFIRGEDDDTRILRRNLVRYMVLTQALVLRDISMQVRKRFPTVETLVAAGLMSNDEMDILDDIHDPYSRYWCPIQWCYSLLCDAHAQGKIVNVYLLDRIAEEISTFRHGLAGLLKYDWVPVPLVYPQVIFLAVRIYFILCLVSRQFVGSGSDKSQIDLWVPITTIIQFAVYVGWMKVAEALLNPLGEDDDDLECNHVIDKNLLTGLTIVDKGGKRIPKQVKDEFWGREQIAPLYALDAAERSVHPLTGSVSSINLVKNKSEIVMAPHKSKLGALSEPEQRLHVRKVCVNEHNAKAQQQKEFDRQQNPDTLLMRIRTWSNKADSHSATEGKENCDRENGFDRRQNTARHASVSPLQEGPTWRRQEQIHENHLPVLNNDVRNGERDYLPYFSPQPFRQDGIGDRVRGLRRY